MPLTEFVKADAKVKYIKNESLPVIKPGWAGNPLVKGRFQNANIPFLPSFANVLRWKLSTNPLKEQKQNDTWRARVVDCDPLLATKEDTLIWLGHASFLIHLNGVRILIDPVLYDIPLYKRFSSLPCLPASLRNIDYILLSHGHMDHCDKRSIRLLCSQNPQVKILTPLRLNQLIERWVPGVITQEAGWYQQYHLAEHELNIYLLPAMHWYKRNAFDTNSALWGSFLLQSPGHTVYFGGDSGYDTHFKEIAALFPQIDMCILGVGAYLPRFMMQNNHMSPGDAVMAFNDLKSTTMVPMHYGTFDLADEPMGEPLRELRKLEQEGKIKGQLLVPDIGEVIRLKNSAIPG